jgi:hypothetical protein
MTPTKPLNSKPSIWAVLVVSTALTLPAQAQKSVSTRPEKASRWSIGLTAGPAFPVGKFVNPLGPGSGTVHAGGSAEINGEYRLCHTFSATMVLQGQINNGNVLAYMLPNPADGYLTGPYGDKDWRIARLLAGGIYTLPLSKQKGPALLIRLLAGIQKTRTADYHYSNQMNNIDVAYPGISFPWAFSYEADAGIKWPLPGKRIALIGYAGYNGCKPAKDFVYNFSYLAYPANGIARITQRHTFPTGTIHARVGIEVQL